MHKSRILPKVGNMTLLANQGKSGFYGVGLPERVIWCKTLIAKTVLQRLTPWMTSFYSNKWRQLAHIFLTLLNSDFFTNLFLWVPGLTRPKFFASQTRSCASNMGPILNHKFYVSIRIRPIHRSQFPKQDTGILTYTIKIKLTLSCKIIYRAQVISLCSSNSACLQVYCWKLMHLSPWTYHINFSFYHLCTVQSQYFMSLQ